MATIITNNDYYDNPEDLIELNPIIVFTTLFVAPYVLFFLLLMLITGQTDPQLLLYSVLTESDTAVIKTWVIGSFILAVLGTLWFSGVQTKRVIFRWFVKYEEPAATSVKSSAPHYVIEETDSDEHGGPLSPKRYARLDSTLDAKAS